MPFHIVIFGAQHTIFIFQAFFYFCIQCTYLFHATRDIFCLKDFVLCVLFFLLHVFLRGNENICCIGISKREKNSYLIVS